MSSTSRRCRRAVLATAVETGRACVARRSPQRARLEPALERARQLPQAQPQALPVRLLLADLARIRTWRARRTTSSPRAASCTRRSTSRRSRTSHCYEPDFVARPERDGQVARRCSQLPEAQRQDHRRAGPRPAIQDHRFPDAARRGRPGSQDLPRPSSTSERERVRTRSETQVRWIRELVHGASAGLVTMRDRGWCGSRATPCSPARLARRDAGAGGRSGSGRRCLLAARRAELDGRRRAARRAGHAGRPIT